jgi:phthiodiolone/phenolphthiodiolone dimycocerosates ketoreductase
MAARVEIDVPILIDRHFPVDDFLAAARAFEASGVVDYIQGWDQLTSWWPPQLWSAKNAPLHAVRPDCDSFPDYVSMLSAAAAVAPKLGTVISLDSVRRGPAELMQTMLTMANLTKGRSQFHFGAGEIKQCKPFGWKRSEGLARMEDIFKAFRMFWEEDGPISMEGNHWVLDDATIGGAKAYRPQVWGLGGGPKLMDFATSYADGFATMVPFVAYSPERWHEMVTAMKQALEQKGRDPEAFTFGLYAANLIHEDEAVVEHSLENPLVKWCTGVMGRIIMSDWEHEGIEPPLPPNWHYAVKLLPHKITQGEIDAILGNVTPEMSQKSWIMGTPGRVARDLQPYIDAGARWISIIDMLPAVLAPEDAIAAPGRTIEVAGRLKAANGRVVEGAADTAVRL